MDKRNMRYIKGEISNLVVVGALVVAGVAILITTTLNKEPKTTGSYAQASGCPYDSGQNIPLGGTETDANNAENRWPISQYRSDYDGLGNASNFQSITDEGVLTLSKSDGGPVDGLVQNFMASMFGYKPKRLLAAYDPPNVGGTYVLEVPVDSNNQEVKVPTTGYDIGGGYEAMVVFAASDRVTLHIGRHEYFTGTKICANGKTCSGGYWIYVKNICVDQQIQDAYNQVKGAQEAAGADLNPIQLPMVHPGQILGKANSNGVLIGVRDNGPYISIFKPDYWGGVPVRDVGTEKTPTPNLTSAPIPTQTPIPVSSGMPTNTSVPLPTSTTTPTPTINQPPSITPIPTQELYNINIPFFRANQNQLTLTPTPVPPTRFTITFDIDTATLCNSEILAIASTIFQTEVLCPTSN